MDFARAPNSSGLGAPLLLLHAMERVEKRKTAIREQSYDGKQTTRLQPSIQPTTTRHYKAQGMEETVTGILGGLVRPGQSLYIRVSRYPLINTIVWNQRIRTNWQRLICTSCSAGSINGLSKVKPLSKLWSHDIPCVGEINYQALLKRENGHTCNLFRTWHCNAFRVCVETNVFNPSFTTVFPFLKWSLTIVDSRIFKYARKKPRQVDQVLLKGCSEGQLDNSWSRWSCKIA